ncbi:MAG: hypothetical protein SV686_14605 [Thermodesulfobacteriota bacterium]|nr:hypothetical protein [Thermodesulfobacteriota bacterium]
MSKDSVTGLILATMLEAEPFIQGLSLEKSQNVPFPIYTNDSLRLIISGIGKVNAATACTYVVLRYHPGIIVNLGAAGATKDQCPLGESYHIKKVIEPDRPHLRTGRPYEHTPTTLEGFQEVTLATQDKPVLDPQERKTVHAELVDMEGASVVQVCRHFQTECYLFKFVSDTATHTESKHIRENIEQYRNLFFTFFCSQVLTRLVP